MLNLNYTLLSEGANSRYRVPSYRNYDNSSIYNEGYMITKITEFNQIMRECQVELASIIPSHDYIIPISEAGAVTSIVNTIRAIIQKVIDGVKNIFTAIRNFIISIIKNIIEKINNSSDKSIDKLRLSERVKILRKAIYDLPADQSIINSCDLNITRDLASNDFPNIKFIGSKFSKMVINSINNYVINYDVNDYIKGEKVEGHISNSSASESLADYLDMNTNDIFSGIFGKYQYDITNPKLSVEEASIKAFGSNEIKNTKITVDLYLLACDNINNIKDISNKLNNELEDIEKLEKEIKDSLNKAQNSIKEMNIDLSKTSKNHDLYKDYTEATRKLINNLNRITNFVNEVIAVEMTIIRNKAQRAATILKCSNSIKRKCNQIINNYIGTEESTNEVYDPSDDVRDAKILEEQFESILCMTEEFWLENEYNQNIMQYITEEDTGASLANTQKSSQNKLGDLGETLVVRFNQLFDRFRETFLKGSIMVDSNFWNRNRAKINSLGETIGKTNIADWYEYDINKFKIKLDSVKYDDSATYLNSDQEFQDFILSKFGSGNAKFTGDAANNTFSKKMLTVFYDNYIEKDKLTALGSTKYNHDLAFGFINDCIRNGFNGEYLGSIRDDRKFINESLKTANKNIKNTEDKIKDDKVAMKATTTTVSTTGTPSNDGGGNVQVTNNSAIDNSDFRFNLAEHFGLVVGEKVINLNELQTQVPDDLKQQSDDTTGNKTAEQLAKARINRYFKYMTFAVSAKMTTELKAYKQYMGLFKSLYKGGNTKNNTQNTNNQNQQNAEQQQNQNSNTEGNK